MKKLVSVLFALLLIGSFAFAQDAEKPSVKVGAWGRLMFVPASNVTGDVASDLDDMDIKVDPVAFGGPNWAGGGVGGMNTGFAVSASSENVGFAIDLDVNGGTTMNFGDQSKAWIKFNDMITLQMGKIQGDVLRGKVDDSGYLGAIAGRSFKLDATHTLSTPLVVGTTGKDDLFKRFNPQGGILLDLTPAEGVYLGMALDTPATGGTVKSEDMFKAIQVGAGYVIPNIGHLRAQYIGAVDETTVTGVAGTFDVPKYIQVAFAYTALEGIVIDAGLKYQTVSDVGKSLATVAGTYSADALSAVVRLQVGFGSNEKAAPASSTSVLVGNDDLLLKASADVSYLVSDPLAIGGEISFMKEGDPVGFTVVPYAKVGYANGFVKAGFAYTSYTDAVFDVADPDTGKALVNSYGAWAIPIMVQFSF
jgi:hypothetical protein